MEKTFAERVAEAKTAVSPVSTREAQALQTRDDVIIVDPRPAEAIAETTGLILGAHNVPMAEIAAGNLPEAISNRNLHVITACQAGPMAAIAAHEFTKAGFTRVNYTDGGTPSWLDAGNATVR